MAIVAFDQPAVVLSAPRMSVAISISRADRHGA
jgi:hypothetical protein